MGAHSGQLMYYYGLKEQNYYTVVFAVSRTMGVMAQYFGLGQSDCPSNDQSLCRWMHSRRRLESERNFSLNSYEVRFGILTETTHEFGPLYVKSSAFCL